MIALLNDFRLVWRQGLIYRVPGVIRSACLLGGFIFASTLGLYLDSLGNIPLEIGCAAVAGGTAALCCLWAFLVRGIVRLNTPFCARLVPRIRGSMVFFTWSGFLVLTALLTVLSSIVLGHVGLCMLGSAWFVLMIGPGLMNAWSTWLLIVGIFAFEGRNSMPKGLLEIIQGGYFPLLMAPLLFMGVRSSIGKMLSRDTRQIEHVARTISQESGQLSRNVKADPGVASRPRLLFSSMLRQSTNPAKRRQLLLIALGIPNHWTSTLGRFMMLCAQLLLPVLGFRGIASGDSDVMNVLGWVVLTCFVVPWQGVASEDLAHKIWTTSGEQALFRLTPHAPNVPEINRELAIALFQCALRQWLLTVVVIEIGTWLIGAHGATLLAQGSACAIGLPATAFAFRDYSRDDRLHGFGIVWVVLAMAVLIALMVVRYFVGLQVFHIFAVLCVIFTGLILAYRWRAMMAAPPAFPAGRLPPHDLRSRP